MISFKNSTLPLKFNNFFSMKNQIHDSGALAREARQRSTMGKKIW